MQTARANSKVSVAAAALLPGMCALFFLWGVSSNQSAPIKTLAFGLIYFSLSTLVFPIVVEGNFSPLKCAGLLAASLTSCLLVVWLAARPSPVQMLHLALLAVAHGWLTLALFGFLKTAVGATAYPATCALSFFNIGSVFALNPWVESIRGLDAKTRLIDALLTLNPASALAYAGLNHIDWLHAPKMYELCVIGPNYAYRHPSLLHVLATWATGAVVLMLLGACLKKIRRNRVTPPRNDGSLVSPP